MIYLPDGSVYHDTLVDIGEDVDGVFFKNSQYIPDEFLSGLKRLREDSMSTPAGEMHLAARVPAATADKWMREGFDIFVEPATAILARLRKEQLDGFIASNKI
jgi:hypothetical protein